MLFPVASILLNEAMDNYIDRQKKGGNHSLSLAYVRVRATILELRKKVDKWQLTSRWCRRLRNKWNGSNQILQFHFERKKSWSFYSILKIFFVFRSRHDLLQSRTTERSWTCFCWDRTANWLSASNGAHTPPQTILFLKRYSKCRAQYQVYSDRVFPENFNLLNCSSPWFDLMKTVSSFFV